MSTRDAADYLGYSMQHTRFLVREGTLPGLKFGRDWLVSRREVTLIYTRQRAHDASRDSLPPATQPGKVTMLQAVNVSQVPQRSPFRYPGGKTWLIPYIKQWLSSTRRAAVELIEPFAGGGIVSLTAIFDDLIPHATMVELDEDVAAVWQVILNGNGPRLAERISNFHPTTEALKSLFAEQDFSLEARAFATVVRNRVARGGILAPGAGIVKNGENGKGLTSRWYPETLCRRILDIVAQKDRIVFIPGDGLQTMREHAAQPDCLWFIDPPYTVAGKRLYLHSDIDHEELFHIVSTLQGDFLITYDNAAEIQYLAEKAGLDTRQIAMTTTHHTAKRELLIGRSLDWLPM